MEEGGGGDGGEGERGSGERERVGNNVDRRASWVSD